jgi:hypothetical protein
VRVPRAHLLRALTLLAALPSGDARAEEVFCDPEDPTCVAVPADATSDDLPEPSDTFCDPEDPTCVAEEPDPGSFCDPEDPTCAPDEEGDAKKGSGFVRSTLDFDLDEGPIGAEYVASWSTTGLLDTSWQGQGEDVVELASTLSLELSYELDVNTRLVVAGQILHWMGGEAQPDQPNLLVNAANPRAELDVRLGESYARWRSGSLTVRAGNLLTSWGSTDLTRPGDVINPTDARTWGPSPAGAGQRVPQPSVEASWAWDGGALSAVFVPFFVPDYVVLVGRDAGFLDALGAPTNPGPMGVAALGLFDPSSTEELNGFLSSAVYPDERPEHVSGGVRLTATAWNTDVGLGYFVGWNRTPFTTLDPEARELSALALQDGQVLQDLDVTAFLERNPQAAGAFARLNERAGAGERLVTTGFRRRQTLVADVARYLGPIGVRADVAFSPAQVFVGEDLSGLRRPTISSALGLGYERVDGDRALALSLEGFWIEPLGRDHALTRAFVPEGEEGPEGVEPLVIGDRLLGVAGGGRWQTPLWDLDLEAGGVFNVTTRDLIAQAAVSRRFSSWLVVRAGALVYEGPDPQESLSVGGLYDRNDQVFVSVGGSL